VSEGEVVRPELEEGAAPEEGVEVEAPAEAEAEAPPPEEELAEAEAEARPRARPGRIGLRELRRALRAGESLAYSAYDSLRGKRLAPWLFFELMGRALMGLAALSLLVGVDAWLTVSLGPRLGPLFTAVSVFSFPLYFALATSLYVVLVAGATGPLRIARAGWGLSALLWALTSGLMGYALRRAGLFVAVAVASDVVAQLVFLLLVGIVMLLLSLAQLVFSVVAAYALLLVVGAVLLWVLLILLGAAAVAAALYPFVSLALAYVGFRVVDRYIAGPALRASDASLTLMALALHLSRFAAPAAPAAVAGAVTMVSGMVSAVKGDLKYMKPAVTAWGLLVGMSLGPAGPDPLADAISSVMVEYGDRYGNAGAALAGLLVGALGRI